MHVSQQYTSLRSVHRIDWVDIFAVWRSYEAYQEKWEQHWRERGFASWDEWRRNYSALLWPERHEWRIYRITRPIRDVPLFYGVPSRGWQEKCYGGESTKMISDIVMHPTVTDNPKMREIEKNFPHQTMLIGLIHNERIVLVEDMHRACALAYMQVCTSDVVIALATYDGELPFLGKGDKAQKHMY